MSAELFAANPSKGEQARQRLLLAALEKIGEKGYDNASVREIADAAGQNIAAISYYFGSKEKLYAEVIEGIVSYLKGAFAEVSVEAKQLLESGQADPATAAALLKRMLRIMLMEHIERAEICKLRNVMMREQAAPTGAFEELYNRGIKPHHELFTRVLAVVSGDDPDTPQAILRAHALLGQVLGFTVARFTILRRLGIEKFGTEHSAMIAGLLDEHIESITTGILNQRINK